jgi:hypothetical protein
VIDGLDEYADLAEEQGWRTKKTATGIQFFPPNMAPIVTLQKSGDPHVKLNWRAQLRRAGLTLPEDEARKRKTAEQHNMQTTTKDQGSQSPCSPGPEPELSELFARAEKKIGNVLAACADLEDVLKDIRKRAEKNERVRALLKELQA